MMMFTRTLTHIRSNMSYVYVFIPRGHGDGDEVKVTLISEDGSKRCKRKILKDPTRASWYKICFSGELIKFTGSALGLYISHVEEFFNK